MKWCCMYGSGGCSATTSHPVPSIERAGVASAVDGPEQRMFGVEVLERLDPADEVRAGRRSERVHQSVAAFGDLVDVEREEQPALGCDVAAQDVQHRAVVVRREVREHREEADDVERAGPDGELGRGREGRAGAVVALVVEVDRVVLEARIVDASTAGTRSSRGTRRRRHSAARGVVVQQRLGELHPAADVEDVTRAEILEAEIGTHVLDRVDGRCDRLVFVLALSASKCARDAQLARRDQRLAGQRSTGPPM